MAFDFYDNTPHYVSLESNGGAVQLLYGDNETLENVLKIYPIEYYKRLYNLNGSDVEAVNWLNSNHVLNVWEVVGNKIKIKKFFDRHPYNQNHSIVYPREKECMEPGEYYDCECCIRRIWDPDARCIEGGRIKFDDP